MLEEKMREQQKEIDELLERLRECEEKLGFYADDDSYRSKHGGHIQNKNFHSRIGQDCGKRAREYFKKYEGFNDNK